MASPILPRLSGLGVALAIAVAGALTRGGVDRSSSPEVRARPGFRVEQVYRVPPEQGSWIALAVDDRGRLTAADQFGGLYRITLRSDPSEPGPAEVERLETLGVGGAHGLLHVGLHLYVMVTEPAGHRFGERRLGLHRLTDTDGDDRYDQAELVREMQGLHEHGAHGMALSPDRRALHYVNGNETKLPEGLEQRIPVGWGEDHVVPRLWPPVGSGRGVTAPGGYVGRMDLEGNAHELFAIGLRNCYRIAIDPNGEIFTQDSDTENELGVSWYLPTRLVHVVSGGEYGWRSGSGRWPPEYADSLPPLLDTGPGSPTAAVMGTGTRFPARYQRALFVGDWTNGAIHAIHLTPEGATFRGEREELVAGTPLPITDLVVHPLDGAMYFIVGGRQTESSLYRIRYVGDEPTDPASYPEPTPEARLRRRLEQLHQPGMAPETVLDAAWPHLSHADRFVRWAARVAIERQPVGSWAERALDEADETAALEALLALVRHGPSGTQARLVARLQEFDFTAMPVERQRRLLRLWQLAFTRSADPDPDIARAAVTHLERHFPHDDPFISRELAGLLVRLGSSEVVAKAVPLLETGAAGNDIGSPPERGGQGPANPAGEQSHDPEMRFRQQMAYVTALRTAKSGWTPGLRERYFRWFNRAYRRTGGISYDLFVNAIRSVALAAVDDPAERARLAALSERPPPEFRQAAPPQGPGQAYTVSSALAALAGPPRGRSFEKGRSHYIAVGCVHCHRMKHLGVGTAGPMLNRAGSRYSERDLLTAIIDPSASVNENYAATQYTLKDGTTVVGYPGFEEGGILFVTTNLMMPNMPTPIAKQDIVSVAPFAGSLMPPGLINGLNPEELRDLVAFILSGGDPAHVMFREGQPERK